MEAFMQPEVSNLMAKSSEAHIRANAKYYEANMHRVSVALNRKTQSDVIEKFDSVESKLGYVVCLVRNDLYRKFHAKIIIDGVSIDPADIARYAELIYERIDDIKAQCDPETFERSASLFREGTPDYIVVGEYLRTTDSDIIVGNPINLDLF